MHLPCARSALTPVPRAEASGRADAVAPVAPAAPRPGPASRIPVAFPASATNAPSARVLVTGTFTLKSSGVQPAALLSHSAHSSALSCGKASDARGSDFSQEITEPALRAAKETGTARSNKSACLRRHVHCVGNVGVGPVAPAVGEGEADGYAFSSIEDACRTWERVCQSGWKRAAWARLSTASNDGARARTLCCSTDRARRDDGRSPHVVAYVRT